MNLNISRIKQSIRWRLGMPVAAPALEKGTDESVSEFYNSRVTGCEFLDDPTHYEHTRASWVLEQVNGGTLLEIGCGNGGMTRLLAPRVEKLTAFDVSRPSLEQLEEMALPNVETAQGLIENFDFNKQFDWIVLSEVIEHLRDPFAALRHIYQFLMPGGFLLITTPNGHWESDEHLQEFSMGTFAELLTRLPGEAIQISFLRDRDDRRRWLTAIVHRPETEPAADDFFDVAATRRLRKQKY